MVGQFKLGRLIVFVSMHRRVRVDLGVGRVGSSQDLNDKSIIRRDPRTLDLQTVG